MKKLLILLMMLLMLGITSCKTIEQPKPIQIPTLTIVRPSKPIIKPVEQDTAIKDLTLALTQVMGYSERQDLYIDSLRDHHINGESEAQQKKVREYLINEKIN